MAEKILNTRIQLKYDTLENWQNETGAAVVLKKGEVAICAVPSEQTAVQGDAVRPQVLMKVGDGTSQFSELKWVSALAADVYSWAKKSEGEFLSWIKGQISIGNYYTKGEIDEKVNGINGTISGIKNGTSINDFKSTEAALEGKQAKGDYAQASHTHVAANITDLDETIQGYDYATKSDAQGYANAKDAAIEAAKKAGENAQSALDAYKGTNDAAVQLKADQSALTAEIQRATAAEKKNADAIELLTNGSSPDEVDGVKDLIDYVKTHGTEVTQIKADIKSNTSAIGTEKSRAEQAEQALGSRIDGLSGSTHSHENKEVLDGISSSKVANWDAAYSEKHTHENKSVLDGISSSNISSWNAAEQNAKSYADGLSSNYATSSQGAKADSALQEITTSYGGGLKVTSKGQIDIDTSVVFVFDCGSSTSQV